MTVNELILELEKLRDLQGQGSEQVKDDFGHPITSVSFVKDPGPFRLKGIILNSGEPS